MDKKLQLKKSIKALTFLLARTSKELQRMENDTESLNADNESLKKGIGRLHNEIQELTAKLVAEEAKSSLYLKEIESLKSQGVQVSNNLDMSNPLETFDYKSSNSSSEVEATKYKPEDEKCRADYMNVTNELIAERKLCYETQQTVNKLQEQISYLKKEISWYEAKNDETNNERDDKDYIVNDGDKYSILPRAAYQTNVSKLKSQITDLELSLDAREVIIIGLQIQIAKKDEENESLLQKLQQGQVSSSLTAVSVQGVKNETNTLTQLLEDKTLFMSDGLRKSLTSICKHLKALVP